MCSQKVSWKNSCKANRVTFIKLRIIIGKHFAFYNSRLTLLKGWESPWKLNQSRHTLSLYPVLDRGLLEKNMAAVSSGISLSMSAFNSTV